MRKSFILVVMFAGIGWAQPPVAPTSELTGNPDGDNVANYNVVQSFEIGYRWRTTGGDEGMYASSVNYGDGIRLLSSSLFVQSIEGKRGRWFDQIVLNTEGLGNDPYQSASLRVEKNGIYRYEMLWRSNDYVNPALTISNDQHLLDTTRRLQDHDLTLFPQSKIKLFLGYSRNVDTGAALTTVQLFDSQGNEFPLFSNVHQEQNEYRLGGEAILLGFRLNVLHGWEDFKDDTPVSLIGPSLGNNPNNLTTLTSLSRTNPDHGTSPYWRVGLFREGKRLWAVNGKFTYVAGKGAFVTDESAVGTSRFGANLSQQIATFGNAQRPSLTANFTISVFPSSKVTVSTQASYNDIRMIGDSYFVQYLNGLASPAVLPFQYLGIRTLSSSTAVDYHPKPWFAVHAGYDYDNRRIAALQGQENFGAPPPAPPANTPLAQTNQLHAGTLGFRIKPVKPVTINLDAEVGRADHPIYPISDGNYQALRGRVEYKQKTFRLAGYARSDYNTNSMSLTSYASQSRQYGVDASWSPTEWFSIDAGYGKMHLYTLAGIDYFAGTPAVDISGESSLYISNIHTANLGARFRVWKRADVSLGYSHVQDLGDGRATAVGAGLSTALPALQAAQTFPLRFLSPQARLSIRLKAQIRWNAGYQYYGYNEQFSALQNYRAHTGYTSLSWSF